MAAMVLWRAGNVEYFDPTFLLKLEREVHGHGR